jgi:adenylate cyclase
MRRSPEIEAVFRRIFSALRDGDQRTFRNHFSPSPDLWWIGSDEREWFRGDPESVDLFEQQVREFGLVDVAYKRSEAYEDGSVGWIAAEVELFTTTVDVVPARITVVFVLDAGLWRVVQWHTSIGIPNEEIFGFELTLTLDSLLASLDDETTEAVLKAASEGTATIMFTDITDSTELSQTLGDEAWLDVIRSHFETLRRIVEEEGGTVVKTLGDGGMFAFVSARSALRAAMAIQQAVSSDDAAKPLAVRIGVHSGDVVQEGGDYLGITVSKAARITSAADGGEVMVSSVVAELAGAGAFEFGAPFQAELKGLTGTHQIFPLVWDEPVAGDNGATRRSTR